MNRTKIDWADFTWNPVVGCTGSCPYCYARKMAHRFHRDFTPHWVQKNYDKPMPKKPSRIFVNSMSDVADWEDDWYSKVWRKMSIYPKHLFVFLSKRPWNCSWVFPPNAMLGYSLSRQADLLMLTASPGAVSFLSIEPIHGPIRFTTWKPRWIIVGAETGNRKGRIIPKWEWLAEIGRYCKANHIPLFCKSSLTRLWPDLPREYPEGLS